MFYACLAILLLFMIMFSCVTLAIIDLEMYNFGLYIVLLCIVGQFRYHFSCQRAVHIVVNYSSELELFVKRETMATCDFVIAPTASLRFQVENERQSWSMRLTRHRE